MTHYFILNGGRQASAAVRGSAARRPPIFPPANSRCGSGLILTVLFVALVGILLGLGRLAMFRDQCVRRFDRQREIERLLATRSVLQYVQAPMKAPSIPKRLIHFMALINSTNHFVYRSATGRRYELTLRPAKSVLESDLTEVEWTGIETPPVSSTYVSDGKRRFEFDGTGTGGAICLVGRELPVSWLDYPWGLRYVAKPEGAAYGDNISDLHPGTAISLFIVGGQLPETGVSLKDLQQNPVIRIDDLWQSGPDDDSASLQVFWGSEGLDTIDETTPLTERQEDVRWIDFFGIQLAGNIAAVVGQGSPTVSPVMKLGRIPEPQVNAFKQQPRLYVGIRQVGVITNIACTFTSIAIRPPYEWDVLIAWEGSQGWTQEVATVVHAADSTGEGNVPDSIVTYDTHGTQWRPGGR